MAKINENYLKLKAGYLFPEIGRRVAEFQKNNPDAKVIKMGIGDVTMPLVPSVIKAFHEGGIKLAFAGDNAHAQAGTLGIRLDNQRKA